QPRPRRANAAGGALDPECVPVEIIQQGSDLTIGPCAFSSLAATRSGEHGRDKGLLTEHPFSAVRFHYPRLVSRGIGSPVSLPRYSAAEPEHDDERAGQQSAPEVRARCEPAHAVPTG